jgi:hypothetical protein
MTRHGDEEPAIGAEVSRHLSAAHHHLYLALLHLAAIDGDLKCVDFAFSRRSIAASLEEIKSVHGDMSL